MTHPWWPHLLSFPRFLDPLSWFWLSLKGYAFTSSGLQLTIPFGLGLWIYKHNCHQLHCLRLAWHPDDTGHPKCKHHHPDHPAGTGL